MKNTLSEKDQRLVLAARDFLLKSPDRDMHNVATAIRSTSGEVFTAYNVFKGYWSGSVCAEVGGLAVAVSTLAPQKFEAELFASVKFNRQRKDIEIVNTCGRCLQWMKDFYPLSSCVVVEDDGSIVITSLQALLPHGYDNKRGIIE